MRAADSTLKRIHTIILILLSAMLLTAPQAAALSSGTSLELEPVCLEDTLFLGEAVPMRCAGEPIGEVLRQQYEDTAGELEAFYVSPQGMLPLEELGRQRPKADEDFKISAVLHREDGKDAWKYFTYRVQVVSGTLRVQVDGADALDGIAPEDTVLFRLEGRGLTLYRQAAIEADPQGGPARLEAEFSGLPYGVYRVTSMDSGEEQTARLGVCETDDTISAARNTVTLRFAPAPTEGKTVGESYQLRAQP